MDSGMLILCPSCRLCSAHSTVRPGGSQRKQNPPQNSLDATRKYSASSQHSGSRPGLWVNRIQTQSFSFAPCIFISLRTNSTPNGKPSLRQFRLSLPRTAILIWIFFKKPTLSYGVICNVNHYFLKSYEDFKNKQQQTKQKQTFHSKFKIQSL